MTSLTTSNGLSQLDSKSSIPSRANGAPDAPAAGGARDWAWLGLIVVTGLVCRCAFQETKEVWFDEAFSWRLASLPAGQIPAAAQSDHHPPLYFFLLYGWLRVFGDSPVAMRSLSVLASLAAIVGIYLLVREAVGGPLGRSLGVPGPARRAALTTAALAALSSYQIGYGMETRMYALGAALSVFSAWILLLALTASRIRWRYWLLFVLLDLLFVYTHNFALLTVAAQGLFVGGWLFAGAGRRWWTFWRQPQFLPSCAAFAFVAAGYAPWIPALRHQVDHSEIRAWLPALTSPWQVGDLIYQAVTGVGMPLSKPAALVSVLLLGLCLVAVGRRGRAGDWFVLALGTIPIAITIAACLAGMRLLNPRYLAFAQPFLLAAAGMTLARSRLRLSGKAAATILIAADCFAGVGAFVWPFLHHPPGFRGAAQYVARQRRPGEPIVVADGLAYLPIRYYSSDRTDLYVHPGDHESGVWVPWVLGPDEILDNDRLASWSGRRVWVANLVGMDPPTFDRVAITMDNTVTVPSGWRLCSRTIFKLARRGEIEVLEYEAPATGS